jgi:hypothetical protein
MPLTAMRAGFGISGRDAFMLQQAAVSQKQTPTIGVKARPTS